MEASLFANLLQQAAQSANNGGPTITEDDSDSENPVNTSFVPRSVIGRTVSMKASKFSKTKMPTLILGLITDRYNEASFKYDKSAIIKLLGMEENDPMIFDLKLYPRAVNKDQMDIEACVAKINAMADSDAFGKGPYEAVRIIRMGNAGHNFLFQAMVQVLENYGTPSSKVEFVTLADTSDCDWLDFSKSIIGTGLVGEVEYINTMDYTPFGQFKPKKEVNMF